MAALCGVRVLDLSRVLAGPWAGQTLADLGAEVIKIERPGVGDDTRGWGPPFVADEQGQPSAESAYFQCANRNKQSLTLDLAHPEGQRILSELALQSDVLIENFKVGGMAAYGLDYPSLSVLNPRLIYCSITGFGQTGPYAHKPGYDFMIQGLGGLMSLTGRADDEPGAGPMKVGVALTDILTGLYASVAILAAMQQRERSGAGQYIDLALLDVQVAALANQASAYLVSGQLPVRRGNAHPSIVPYQDFPTADGELLLTVGNDLQFRRFCAVVGRPEWAEDPRFASNAARVAHRVELVALIRQRTVFRTTADWMAELEAAGVPCGPVNDLAQVFADPQVQARGLRVELPHGLGGSLAQVASPLRLSDSPVDYRNAAPLLGADSEAVLRRLLGLDDAALQALRRDGVI